MKYCFTLLLVPAFFIASYQKNDLPTLEENSLNIEVGYCMGVVITNAVKCFEAGKTCGSQTKTVSLGPGRVSIPTPLGNVPIVLPAITIFKWGCDANAVEIVANTCPAQVHEIIDPQNPNQVIGGYINPNNIFCLQTKQTKPCIPKFVNKKVLGLPSLLWERLCITDPAGAVTGGQWCGGQFASRNDYQNTCPVQ